MKIIYAYTGEEIIVDDDMYNYLNQFKWSLHTGGYVKARINGKLAYMHRIVNGTPKGLATDHINKNKLDNRRENLRTCTDSQNQQNSRKPCGECKYRGVTHTGRRYTARIKINRKHKHIGSYGTPEEAALAYNEYAKKYHGEFAILNTIPS